MNNWHKNLQEEQNNVVTLPTIPGSEPINGNPTLPKLGQGIPERCSIVNNATLIYTHDFCNKVYMFAANDYGTRRQSFGFVVVSATGETSRPVYVKRSELITKKVPLEFMYNFLADFTHDDIAKIKNEVQNHMQVVHSMDFSESVSPEELYLAICEYCENPANEENEGHITIADGHCNIPTQRFAGVIKDLDCGYKKLEALRELKLMNLLRTNEGRPYDYKITDKNGYTYRVNSIKHLDCKAREAYRTRYLDKPEVNSDVH